ncbi:hypothetical protein MOUN0_K09956 [Monosporozyma unispora]
MYSQNSTTSDSDDSMVFFDATTTSNPSVEANDVSVNGAFIFSTNPVAQTAAQEGTPVTTSDTSQPVTSLDRHSGDTNTVETSVCANASARRQESIDGTVFPSNQLGMYNPQARKAIEAGKFVDPLEFVVSQPTPKGDAVITDAPVSNSLPYIEAREPCSSPSSLSNRSVDEESIIPTQADADSSLGFLDRNSDNIVSASSTDIGSTQPTQEHSVVGGSTPSTVMIGNNSTQPTQEDSTVGGSQTILQNLSDYIETYEDTRDNPPPDLKKIDKDIFYLNGFLLMEEKPGKFQIFDLKHPPKYISKNARSKLSKTKIYPLFDWDLALAACDKGFGIKVDNKTLFKLVGTTSIEAFYHDNNFMKKTIRRPFIEKGSKTYTLKGIQLGTKNYKGCFLYYGETVESEFIDREDVILSHNINISKDQGVYNLTLEVYKFPHTPADWEMMWKWEEYKDTLLDESADIIKHVFDFVDKKFPTKVGVPSYISGWVKEEVFPKRASPGVLKSYINHGNLIFFIIRSMRNLSFYKTLILPERFSFLALTKNREDNIKSYTNFFLTLFTDCEGLTFVWRDLTRLMALDWSSYKAIDPNVEVVPETLPLQKYRKSLDALRQIAINFTLYSCCSDTKKAEKMIKVFTDPQMRSPLFKSLNNLYGEVVAEYDQQVVPFEILNNHAVTVRRKTFSLDYIRLFYTDIKNEFDNLVSELRKFTPGLKNVEQFSDFILNSTTTYKLDTDTANVSSIHSIFKEDEQHYLPLNFIEEVDYTAVFNIIDKMSACSAWFIFYSSGGPPRFSDINLLRVGTDCRNIFWNHTHKYLEIMTTYSKSKSNNTVVTHCDKLTSRYILYYILVIKIIQKRAFVLTEHNVGQGIIKSFNVSVDFKPESTTVTGPKMDPRNYSKFICATFLLVDSFEDSTLAYRKFSAYYKDFPTKVTSSERLNLQETRHAYIGLFRMVTENWRPDPYAQAVENLAHHTETVGRMVYAKSLINKFRCTLQNEKFHKVVNDWQEIVGFETIDSLDRDSLVPKYPALVDGKSFNVQCSIDDLYRAGEFLYGNQFSFRKRQFEICSDFVFSNDAIVCISALPNFGKTTLFHLPFMSLRKNTKNKLLHFVFVPFSVLVSDMIIRLNKGNYLSVGNVEELTSSTLPPPECHLRDVYVGSFANLSSEKFIAFFNGFKERYVNVNVGAVVLDEFHCFEHDWYYRSSDFKNIQKINWDIATKVMAMSGTINGIDGFSAGFKCIGLETSLKTTRGAERAAYIYNCVEGVPLTKIVKVSDEQAHRGASFAKAEKLIDAFLKTDNRFKALVICGYVDDAKKLHEKYEESVLAHGQMKHREKAAALKLFREQPNKRLFMGTCLLGQGLNILSVNLVIFLEEYPTVVSFIQSCGRIRDHGVCWALWNKQPSQIDKSIFDGCLSKKVADFYGDDSTQHFGCCGSRSLQQRGSYKIFDSISALLAGKRRHDGINTEDRSNLSKRMQTSSLYCNSNAEKYDEDESADLFGMESSINNTKEPPSPVHSPTLESPVNGIPNVSSNSHLDGSPCESTNSDLDDSDLSHLLSLPNGPNSDPPCSKTVTTITASSNSTSTNTVARSNSTTFKNRSSTFTWIPASTSTTTVSHSNSTTSKNPISTSNGGGNKTTVTSSIEASSSDLYDWIKKSKINLRKKSNKNSKKISKIDTIQGSGRIVMNTRRIQPIPEREKGKILGDLFNKPLSCYDKDPNATLTISSKELILRSFNGHKSLFDYLDCRQEVINCIKPYYIGGSFFKFNLSKYKNRCVGCGANGEKGCVCIPNDTKSKVFNFGCQIMVLYEIILLKTEYENYKTMCHENGVVYLIVDFIKNKNKILNKMASCEYLNHYCSQFNYLQSRYNNQNLENSFTLKHPAVFGSDVVESYNKFWAKLHKNDIMIFMLKGVYTPGPHFWEPETACNRDQFYLCLSEKFPSLEEFSFLKDYGDESYIASVFKQEIGNLASYVPRKDLHFRAGWRGNPSGKTPFEITKRQFFCFIFFLFHNKSFMDEFYIIFLNVPKFKFFYQWFIWQRVVVMINEKAFYNIFWYYPLILNRVENRKNKSALSG